MLRAEPLPHPRPHLPFPVLVRRQRPNRRPLSCICQKRTFFPCSAHNILPCCDSRRTVSAVQSSACSFHSVPRPPAPCPTLRKSSRQTPARVRAPLAPPTVADIPQLPVPMCVPASLLPMAIERLPSVPAGPVLTQGTDAGDNCRTPGLCLGPDPRRQAGQPHHGEHCGSDEGVLREHCRHPV